MLECSWNTKAHGDAREGRWRGNWRMEWVASTFHTTSERGVSSITTADAHTSAVSSRLNWRPCLFNLLAPGVLHLIQINHQPDATIFQFIILTFIYSSTCFGRFPAHHQELSDCSGSLWFYLRIVVIVVLCSWSGRPAVVVAPDDGHEDARNMLSCI